MKDRRDAICAISQVYISSSAEETCQIGKELGSRLAINSVVTLEGDLGAGKTTLIRGFVEGTQEKKTRAVSSPTFSLLNIYEGIPEIYHFDLYRLPRFEEFLAAGFDEYFCAGGICCVEWPEKIKPLLPENALKISILYLGEEKRKITVHAKNSL